MTSLVPEKQKHVLQNPVFCELRYQHLTKQAKKKIMATHEIGY